LQQRAKANRPKRLVGLVEGKYLAANHFKVFETIKTFGPINDTDLANTLNIPRSCAFHWRKDLQRAGKVEFACKKRVSGVTQLVSFWKAASEFTNCICERIS
jgi:hypothetical protein